MSNQEISRKRKRVSKNKKKTWRKTDVEDVEEHLEDIRLQERTGGIRADKPDHQLFFVDTKVDQSSEEVETQSPRKRRKEPKPLKCHALLEPDPNIKPAKITHNVKQNLLTKRCTDIQKKIENGTLSKTQRQGLHQSRTAVYQREQQTKKQKQLPQVSHDLWADEKQGNEDLHYLKQTKRLRIPRPEHLAKKSSAVPAIEVPHPGSSYNPAYDDHQDLVEKAVGVEIEKEQKELKLKRALEDAFPVSSTSELEQTWLKEMSVGMGEEDETDYDETVGPANPPIRRDDKKTERQRRKEKARKEEEKAAAQAKNANVKKNEIFQLKSIKQNLKHQEAILAEKRQRKSARKEAAKDRPKKLGKLKFEDADLEVKTSDELVGSLRELKPEGHLLADRFKSLQKRNIIEPRQRAKVTRKYKRKTYTKKSHRDV